MQRRCAWCGVDMGRKEPLDDDRVTHGLCPPCSKTAFRSAVPAPGGHSAATRSGQPAPEKRPRPVAADQQVEAVASDEPLPLSACNLSGLAPCRLSP
jgi:hypothetical protein